MYSKSLPIQDSHSSLILNDFGFQVALDKSSAENEQLKEENKRLKEALDSYENGLLSLN